MLPAVNQPVPTSAALLRMLMQHILLPGKAFLLAAIVYTFATSLLTLVVPLAIQTLINSVANTSITQSLVVLTGFVFILLLLSAVLYGLRLHAMELFERHVFARIAMDVTHTMLHACPLSLDGMNRGALMNRFFEVMHVQKSVPTLFIGGITLVLQCVIGLCLVSFYHPYFLALSLVLVLAAFLIWLPWHRGAQVNAVKVSTSRYRMAEWLEELGRTNGFFRSSSRLPRATAVSNDLTHRYLSYRERFFFCNMAQVLGFLTLYVLASTALLGLGGWLVMQGQLTLGQLVAAELVLSGVFYGFTRIGYYLMMYYELCAGAQKLDSMLSIPQEPAPAHPTPWKPNASGCDVRFQQVRCPFHEQEYRLDFTLPPGSHTLAMAEDETLPHLLAELLLAERPPSHGQLLLNGRDADQLALAELRQQVLLVESGQLIAADSIAECFELSAPGITRSQMMHWLEHVELDHVLCRLPDGLDSTLTPNGYPFTFPEQIRLKIALALAAKPSLLILSYLPDCLEEAQRHRLFQRLAALPGLTLLYVTHRPDVEGFSHYLLLGTQQQQFVASQQQLVFPFPAGTTPHPAPHPVEDAQ